MVVLVGDTCACVCMGGECRQGVQHELIVQSVGHAEHDAASEEKWVREQCCVSSCMCMCESGSEGRGMCVDDRGT